MQCVLFRVLPRTVVSACFLLAGSGVANANSLSMSYGELKQSYTYMSETVSFKPVGPAFLMSLDVNENWSVDFDYQKWDDSLVNGDRFRANTDLSGWGTGVSYYKDRWSFGLSYNHSDDESYAESIRRPDERNQFEKTEAKSFGLSVGYGWLSGNVFYNLSLSGQNSDWDGETVEMRREPPPPPPPPGAPPPPPPEIQTIREISSGDVASISASFSMARYWALAGETGVLAGGMLSWNHMVSGESVLVSSTGRRPPPGRQPPGANNSGPRQGAGPGGNNINRAGGGNLASASGDDSYGQVSFYVSYDLSENWSVDFDTGVDIGTEENDVIWSVSLGYFW